MKNVFVLLVFVLLSVSVTVSAEETTTTTTTTMTESITTTTLPAMKGDANGDGVVSDFEVLDHVEKWATCDGGLSDFDLLEAIDNWGDAPITDEDLSVLGDGSYKVTVTRYLPNAFYIGFTSTVSLYVSYIAPEVLGGVIITEKIPSNWTITSSNPTYNVFDSKTGLAKWLLYGVSLKIQDITYTIRMPDNTTGNANFTGVIRIVNSSNPILGDSSVKIRTKINSVTAANRTLPEKANAGSRINVTLNLDVNETSKPNSVIIRDYFPAGWNVSSSEPSANSVNSTMGEIKWILFGESVSDRIISYTLGIPSGVLGNNTFSGEFMYLDQWNSTITGDITGDSVINVEKECLVKGDANCDDAVSDFEILAYVNKWANGEVSDFDLLEAINNWAKG